ncbi:MULTISPECIES: hypothetical protein [Clostridium]|jgi:hypothetical protein|uniref:Uncharacterized protein n=1 Tax=Clostridium chromiireducens TaxID=225345 RepID=A0A1V4IDR1_9CLOT|nr:MULTISPECIES: hypothetical protein [Clostridium]EHJ00348.1 hypothetical protein CDLVIII_3796 [Clostridium sp. DL-VIII]OOM68705.1 hypothetical protein CLOBL_53170 [Clostridium sp. BL-8]OPJ57785.1 hypothetical protein CLCHR_42370 [Clostridium chromiireducens]
MNFELVEISDNNVSGACFPDFFDDCNPTEEQDCMPNGYPDPEPDDGEDIY